MTRFEQIAITALNGLVSNCLNGFSHKDIVNLSFDIAEVMEEKFKQRENMVRDQVFNIPQMYPNDCAYEPRSPGDITCKNCGRPLYEHVIRNKQK